VGTMGPPIRRDHEQTNTPEHTPAFKAKVALAAVKGDRTLAQLRRAVSMFIPIRSPRGLRSLRALPLRCLVQGTAKLRPSRGST